MKLKTPVKKSRPVQTVKAKDAYKEDWEKALVYRNALKAEAEKRGLAFVDPVSDEENAGPDDDSSTQLDRNNSVSATPLKNRPPLPKDLAAEQGSATETEAATTSLQGHQGGQGALGFLKNYRE